MGSIWYRLIDWKWQIYSKKIYETKKGLYLSTVLVYKLYTVQPLSDNKLDPWIFVHQ